MCDASIFVHFHVGYFDVNICTRFRSHSNVRKTWHLRGHKPQQM